MTSIDLFARVVSEEPDGFVDRDLSRALSTAMILSRVPDAAPSPASARNLRPLVAVLAAMVVAVLVPDRANVQEASVGIAGFPLITIIALGALTLLPFACMVCMSFVRSCRGSRRIFA